MEKIDFVLFTFATHTLQDLGFDIKSHIAKDVQEKYLKLLEENYSDLMKDTTFKEYLITVVNDLVAKIKKEEE